MPPLSSDPTSTSHTPSSAAKVPVQAATLTPKPSKRRLVPKKSKISLLTSSNKDKHKDLSDVVRRAGVGSTVTCTPGSFEVYVEPETEIMDEEVGEIVVVRKQKSRAGLNGMVWGERDSKSGVLGQITNVPKTSTKENPALAKIKQEEKEGSGRWWSIGRGRKDSKEKENQKLSKQDTWKRKFVAISTFSFLNCLSAVEYIQPDLPRSKSKSALWFMKID